MKKIAYYYFIISESEYKFAMHTNPQHKNQGEK